MAGDDEGGEERVSVREQALQTFETTSRHMQDRFLPIANISRIMKKALPANAKIAKDAKETVQECVSEFISFITSEASDKCQREKRKTINGDDLLWAMSTLGFEDYIEPLKLYLHKYREAEKQSLAKQAAGEGKKEPASTPLPTGFQTHQPGAPMPYQNNLYVQSYTGMPTSQGYHPPQ